MDTLTSAPLSAWPLALGSEGLLAATVPGWVWGALIVSVFAFLSALTMVLARFPARDAPPPLGDDRDVTARGQEPDEESDGEG